MANTLEGVGEKFFAWLARKNLKQRSLENYWDYFKQISQPDQLCQADVDHLLDLYPTPNCRAMLRNLKEFLMKYTADERLLKQFVAIDIPKIAGRDAKRLPKVLTFREVMRLETVMLQERDKLMLLLSFYGALRKGELFSITKGSFNWADWWEGPADESGEVRVISKGDQEHIAVVPGFLMQRIQDWIERIEIGLASKELPDKTPLFVMSYQRWADILNRAGQMALQKNVNPHCLRHSAATYMLQQGMDVRVVQESLRHASIMSTQIYTHVTKDDLKKKHQQVFG